MAEWIGTEEEPIKVSADDILDAIANGEDVRVEYASVEGDLDIDKITNQLERDDNGKAVIQGDVRIINSEINGYANFNLATFSSVADFRSATFNVEANFKAVTFSSVADFRFATFNVGIDFDSAIFSGEAFFVDATFEGVESNFNSATFSGVAYFWNAIFSSIGTYFNFATFSNQVSFNLATFSGAGVNFIGVKFQSPADFSQIKYWSDSFRSYLAGLVLTQKIGDERYYLFRVRRFGRSAVCGRDEEKRLDKLVKWFLGIYNDSPQGIPQEPTKFYLDSQNIDEVSNPHFKRYVADQHYIRALKESHRFVYRLWRISSNCGRSLSLWAFCSLILALLFGLLYADIPCPSGLSNTVIGDFLDWADPKIYIDKHTADNWFTGFYFSIVTFTTLGFGDVKPADGAGQFWITLEVILGYIMLGGLISILANKLARRS